MSAECVFDACLMNYAIAIYALEPASQALRECLMRARRALDKLARRTSVIV